MKEVYEDSRRGQGPEGQDTGAEARSKVALRTLRLSFYQSFSYHSVADASRCRGAPRRSVQTAVPPQPKQDQISIRIMSDPERTLFFCLSLQPRQLSKATLGSLAEAGMSLRSLAGLDGGKGVGGVVGDRGGQ